MALPKQNLPISFSQGLDTKTDPFQIPFGKFLSLKNSIFQKGGLLQKRNGFPALTALPDLGASFITTFNNDLTSLGDEINAFSSSTNSWFNKGFYQPIDLSVMSLVSTNTTQVQGDTVIAPNGLMCTVYTDAQSSSVVHYKYVIADSSTGQNINPPVILSGGTGSPRVFILGVYFIVVYAVSTDLKYIAIPITAPSNAFAAVNISTTYVASAGSSWNSGGINFDGVVANNYLFLGWQSSHSTNSLQYCSLSDILILSATSTIASVTPTLIAACADVSGSFAANPIIWFMFAEGNSGDSFAFAINYLGQILVGITTIFFGAPAFNITGSSQGGILEMIIEVQNLYPSPLNAIASNYIQSVSIQSDGTIGDPGTVGSIETVLLSVGLASKSFIYNENIYFLTTYDGGTYNNSTGALVTNGYQPTYFLIDIDGNIIAKLAYSNGGGYLQYGLPSALVSGNEVSICYLFRELLEPVAKVQPPQQAPNSGIGFYAQTGLNLVTFTFTGEFLNSAEIGKNLNVTGGFMSGYDGYEIVENGFHLWPDTFSAVWAASGGSIHAQPDGSTNTNAYCYQITYEWSDNQGNIFRSAPSIPVFVTTMSTGTSGEVTLTIPTLRVTAKISNPVKIVIYRWSVANTIFYQTTSIINPILNDPTANYVTYTDKNADPSIVGNNILYTTGGVVENIGAPATSDITLFKSRVFLIDAEDRNLLWYSKQVIEATPVEMSDLFTLYVAPTTSSQQNLGPMTCTFPMDDKLIIFRDESLSYLTGDGPDNTGANNDFSEPLFINSTVGCKNKKSIVFTPNGLMFQSDKGIWLLGRDLSTSYIGAPVEEFNSAKVLSAQTIPGTNEVRFILDNGLMLMYDYYFGQWAVFEGIASVSSTIYQGNHTLLTAPILVQPGGAPSYFLAPIIQQESPGTYLDNGNPVQMSFKTGWFNLTGLQGYERAYFFYFLGLYLSPHVLDIQIAYNYNPSSSKATQFLPDNFSSPYGTDPYYGSNNYGGVNSLERGRVFFQLQKCQSFQITLQETFDPSYGTISGAGLTLSGLNLVYGGKKPYFPTSAAHSIG